MKKLPISIQTFEKLITQNCIYIDKTKYISELISTDGAYFLSRPRRFGKSLLVSTLEALFSGQKDLFKGLYIYDKIDWQKYPIIKIDFSKITFSEGVERFKQKLITYLKKIGIQNELDIRNDTIKETFDELIQKLSFKYNKKVVILIDEYDKPIIDFLGEPQAEKNRELLKEFYGILKPADEFLKFIFITGVSKFSRASIFSDLNNLKDISLTKRFSVLLGYTQQELESYFAERIETLEKKPEHTKEKLLAKIKNWYNGYSWDGENFVYNPFSILQFFDEGTFRNFWFTTGTPTFLVNWIRKNKPRVSDFENYKAYSAIFEAFTIHNLNIISLLFQTGYLTIKQIEKNPYDGSETFFLNFPNQEVRSSFFEHLIAEYTETNLSTTQSLENEMKTALSQKNLERFLELIRSMFASIPYPLHLNHENYYHSLFYMLLKLLGFEIISELTTDKGRIDGVLRFSERIYIIEFKLGKAGKALKQIKKKKYNERFLAEKKEIILLGIGFESKNINHRIEILKSPH